MLPQQEGQQHEQTPVMDDPQHVDSALPEACLVAREVVDVLSNEQGLVGRGGLSDRLCEGRATLRLY